MPNFINIASTGIGTAGFWAKARRPALVAVAGLTAALAFATPAAAASHRPAAPGTCRPIAGLDRNGHTGQVRAHGSVSCPVYGPASMRVTFWVDNTSVKSTSQACPIGTNCYTATGTITPHSGRHRYCSQAWFYWVGPSPAQSRRICEYLG